MKEEIVIKGGKEVLIKTGSPSYNYLLYVFLQDSLRFMQRI